MATEATARASSAEADAAAARAIGAELERRYRAIAEGPMAGIPLCNPALSVEAVGFTVVEGRAVGLVATPWFMNLVVTALPEGAPLEPARIGDTVAHRLPSGDYDCVVGELDGFGRLDALSLFSPMFEFADAATVRATAEAAMAEILRAPVTSEPGAKAVRPIDRRALLFGRRAATGEEGR